MAILQSLFDLIQDGFGVFRAWIVTGDNHKVRIFCGNPAHDRPLQAVSVPAAAKQADQPARCYRAQAPEHLFQCIRLMGIVNENAVVSVCRN